MLIRWTADACAALGIDPAEVDSALVLDLTRTVAHGVTRPAAPLAAYLMGVAVGRGAAPAEVAAQLSRLARAWPSDASDASDTSDSGEGSGASSDSGHGGGGRNGV